MTDDRLAFRYINTQSAQWVKLSPSLATQLAVQVNVRAGHPASRLADRGHSTVMNFELPLSISTVWPSSARTLTGLAFWPAFSLTLLYLLFYCSCWRVTLRRNVCGKMRGIQKNVDQIFFSSEQFEKSTINFFKNLIINLLLFFL